MLWCRTQRVRFVPRPIVENLEDFRSQVFPLFSVFLG